MRFFTMAWWCGSQDDDGIDPAREYAVHLGAIRGQLPSDLLATEEVVSLHDTRLRHLRLEPGEGSLIVELESDLGDEQLTLTYEGVEIFESSADPDVGLGGPAGYGDLGYCEVDVRPDGAFEHRTLFSTGIDLIIAFRRFRHQRNRPS